MHNKCIILAALIAIVLCAIIAFIICGVNMATIYGEAVDGYIYGANAAYAAARSTSGQCDVAPGTNKATIGQQWDGVTLYQYFVYRGYLSFDTSAIPDGAVITAATLYVKALSDKSDTDFDIQVYRYAWAEGLCDNREANFDGAYGGSATLEGTLRSTADGWVAETYYSMAVATGGINKTGDTKYTLVSSRDVSGTSPAGGAGQTQNEHVEAYCAGEAGEDKDPYLVVTYVIAGAASISGAGSLAASAQLIIPATVSISGAGALSAASLSETTPLKITIDGNDRTTSISVDTIRIVDVLGKQTNSASFFLKNGGGMSLAELQEVIISSPSGGTHYFGGYIFTKEGHSRGPLLDYPIECVDYSWDLNHAEALINGTYEGKSDQWIIQNAVAVCIPDIDCTTYVEEVKADTVSREYVQQQPWAVLEDLAKLAGAEWYVDYGPGPGGKNAYLHYFDSGTNTAPHSLSTTSPNFATTFPYDKLIDTTEAPTANKVIVIGAGTVTATRTRGAEGDYGRWLITVLKDNNITTTAQAEERGDALLLAAAATPSYTLTSWQPGLRSGQDVTLVNAVRSLDAAFEIKKVTTRFLGNGYARFNVEMGKYVSGLSDLFRGLAAPVDTPPATPTSASDSTATVTDDRGNQTGSLRLDWADNAELDLSGYQVEALLTGESRWRTQRVTASEAVFEGFALGSSVTARVKAVDLGGHESAYLNFNSGSAITMPADTTAPSLTTNPPTVTAVKKGVRISFTRPTEQDWAYTEFYCSTSNPPTTLVNSDKTTAYIHPTTSYNLHYARYRHVDEAGNPSAYSNVGSATPQQVGGGGGSGYGDVEAGSVDTDQLTNGAVTGVKIENLAVGSAHIELLAVGTAQIAPTAVTNAKIDSMAAAKITAGTITAAVSMSTAGTIDFVDGPMLEGSATQLFIKGTVFLHNMDAIYYDIYLQNIYAQGFISIGGTIVISSVRNLINVQIDTSNVTVNGDWDLGNVELRADTIKSDGCLMLADGMAAPAAAAGYAKLYVDSANGDLYIRFGDGTIKLIMVD